MSTRESSGHQRATKRWSVASCALLLLLLNACSAPPMRAADPSSQPSSYAGRKLNGLWHRVAPGETMALIARRYGVPASDIEEINGIERWERLPRGKVLFVPGARPSGTQRLPAATTTTADGAGRGASSRPTSGKFTWPVRSGKVSSRFGQSRGKRAHEGIDISAEEGTAILAAADGVVIYAGSGVRGYGNLVLVRHDDGFVTVYAHNRKNLVAERDRVTRGQVIAEVGHTGKATGDHLHFEIRMGERPVDPLELLTPR